MQHVRLFKIMGWSDYRFLLCRKEPGCALLHSFLGPVLGQGWMKISRGLES